MYIYKKINRINELMKLKLILYKSDFNITSINRRCRHFSIISNSRSFYFSRKCIVGFYNEEEVDSFNSQPIITMR